MSGTPPAARRRRWPLAWRLSLAVTALAAVVLVVAGVVVTSVLRGFLDQRLDEQVVSLAATAEGAARERDESPGHEGSALPGIATPGAVVALLSPDGSAQVLVLGEGAPEVPAPELAALVADAAPGATTSGLLAGQPYRVALARPDRDDPGVTLVAALPESPLEDTVERLVAVQAVVGGLALLVIAGAGLLIIRTGLAPLGRIAAEARGIAATDLVGPGAVESVGSLALPDEHGSAEVSDLSDALGAMVTHLDDSLAARMAAEQRLRRFVADASHELRTPLASIRGYAELTRRGMASDPVAAELATARIEEEAIRMGGLVDDLLLLARLDQGRPLRSETVDLVRLVRQAADDLHAAEPDRQVVVTVPESAALVQGDPDRLRQVLANLLTNVRVHTPVTAAVEVGVTVSSRTCSVRVRDHGPGMGPAAAEHAFERFYRVDEGRSRDRGGSGLGLSIVRSVVEAQGGTVTLRSWTDPQDHGTEVVVTLPAAQA